MGKLTKRYLDGVHGKEHPKVFEKTDENGLGIRVTQKGKVVFQLRYTHNRKPSRLDVGVYPAMSLEDARSEAYALNTKLSKGIDPKKESQEIKAVNTKSLTLEEVILRWHRLKCTKKNRKEILRSFELHVFPEIGDVRSDSVTKAKWMDLLFEVKSKYPAIAERVLQNAKEAISWAFETGLVSSNPIENITAVKHLGIRKNTNAGRLLSDTDINTIWAASNSCRQHEKNKLLIRLLFFTGCRTGELLTATKEDFDFTNGLWSIPPEKHKAGSITKKPIVRALPLEIMDAVKKCFIVSESNRMFNTTRQTAISVPRNIIHYANTYMSDDIHLEHFSLHDIRRTVRSNLSNITDPFIAEKMLGHEPPMLFKVYDRYDYHNEIRDAYRVWYKRLMDVVTTAIDIQ